MDESTRDKVAETRKRTANYVTCYLHDADLAVLEGMCQKLGIGKSHVIRSALIAYSGIVTHLVKDAP